MKNRGTVILGVGETGRETIAEILRQTSTDLGVPSMSSSEFPPLKIGWATHLLEREVAALPQSLAKPRMLCRILSLAESFTDGFPDLDPVPQLYATFLPSEDLQHIRPSLPLVEVSGPIDKATVKDIFDNPNRLYEMTPRNFEHFVCELFRGLGYETSLTAATRDGGIDILAEKVINGMVHRYAIQCKHSRRPRRKLGVASVRELLGALTDRALTAAILVTNTLFSKEALRFIKRHCARLFGFDSDGLKSLMRQYLFAAVPVLVLEAKA